MTVKSGECSGAEMQWTDACRNIGSQLAHLSAGLWQSIALAIPCRARLHASRVHAARMRCPDAPARAFWGARECAHSAHTRARVWGGWGSEGAFLPSLSKSRNVCVH